MRFLLEIIDGIRSNCGKDFPIVVRLTVDEMYSEIGQNGKGYNLEEGIKMAKILNDKGIDAIDVSSAAYDTFNYWLEPTTFTPGWRKYLASEVKKVVDIPVIAANLIRSPKQAEMQLYRVPKILFHSAGLLSLTLIGQTRLKAVMKILLNVVFVVYIALRV